MNRRLCRTSGILSPIVAFTFIALAIATHPWFSFNSNALSDLGALHTENNWIFNTGLIGGGALALLFSVGIQGKGRSRVENTGYLAFLVASFFMLLIGLFPEDTSPHWYVSVLFYLISAFAMLITGIAYILSERKKEGAFSIILLAIALSLSLGFDWKGIAVPETIGAIAIALWLYMLIFRIKICD